jgi:bifunctional non-homologous end joining protein LigD
LTGKEKTIGRVTLSRVDKVLFPDHGYTKGDLVAYYQEVADHMLPHLRDRPLSLHRFPDGITEPGVFQQSRSGHFPGWIPTLATPRASGEGDPVEHVLCNGTATLVYLVGQGTVTLHHWLSRRGKLDFPDRLLFDLDPSRDDFGAVRWAARQVCEIMERVGLRPCAMTTGSRGLHVLAPVRRELPFDEVRKMANDMAGWLARRHPEKLTTAQRRKDRGRCVYLDTSRNAWGQTSVAPYAVRAIPGAPVATPLALEELDDDRLGPRRWRIDNLAERLGSRGDPWRGLGRRATSILKARRKLHQLIKETKQ